MLSLLSSGFSVVGDESASEMIGRIRGAPDTIADFFKMVLPLDVESCQLISAALLLLLGVIVIFRIVKD